MVPRNSKREHRLERKRGLSLLRSEASVGRVPKYRARARSDLRHKSKTCEIMMIAHRGFGISWLAIRERQWARRRHLRTTLWCLFRAFEEGQGSTESLIWQKCVWLKVCHFWSYINLVVCLKCVLHSL